MHFLRRFVLCLPQGTANSAQGIALQADNISLQVNIQIFSLSYFHTLEIAALINAFETKSKYFFVSITDLCGSILLLLKHRVLNILFVKKRGGVGVGKRTIIHDPPPKKGILRGYNNKFIKVVGY